MNKSILKNSTLFTFLLTTVLGCSGKSEKEPNDNFSLSSDVLYVVAHNNPNSTTTFKSWDNIQVNLIEPGDQLYVDIDIENNELISDYNIEKTDTQFSPTIALTSKDFENLSDGLHFSEVHVRACKDEACNKQYKGSPKTIKVAISVAPESNPDTSCVHVDGNIFIDCVDPTWLGATGWEIQNDSPADYHYFNGDNDFLIQWQMIDTEEDGYNTVIDIQFSDKPANGTFRFHPVGRFQTPKQPIDMSDYSTGAIEFDVRVLDWAHNTSGLMATTECGWPCGSGEIPLGIPEINTWQHYSLKVSDIIDSTIDGEFDLTKIEIGFSIFPAWGEMAGVRFQLDNVRWIKTTPQ